MSDDNARSTGTANSAAIFVFVVTDFVPTQAPWTGSVVVLLGKEPKTEPEFSHEIIRLSCSGVLHPSFYP